MAVENGADFFQRVEAHAFHLAGFQQRYVLLGRTRSDESYFQILSRLDLVDMLHQSGVKALPNCAAWADRGVDRAPVFAFLSGSLEQHGDETGCR